MSQTPKFHRKVLASFITAITVVGLPALTHAQDGSVEEVIVSGVRGAQERAIDIKRNSAEVVDSISSEDIGKLPDNTIADSLQRVTGIQIQRNAGQGGVVAIRGSGEVLTTLNGELFLTAQNILNSNADYQDVPSSLIAGVNVSKSSNAKQLEGGIGGSVDLLTRRSLTLDEGWTAVGRAQLANGSITEENDPEINGLIGFNSDNNYAMSLGFSYADQNLSAHKTETRAANQNRGDALMMMSWDGPVSTKFVTERERLGLTYNFNAQVSDSVELNIDSFYNTMDEKSAGNMFQFDLDTVDWNYGRMEPLGVKSAGSVPISQGNYATGWRATMNSSLRAGVFSNFRDTSATNNNVELKFDGGGDFTGSVRFINSKASRDNDALTLVQRPHSPGPSGKFDDQGYVYNLNGDRRQVNPGYIAGDNFTTTFQTGSDGVSWAFSDDFAQAMQNPAAWYFHSSWLEGERHETNLNVLRADGNYKFGDEGITSVDFGIRESARSMERDTFHYFMPTGLTAYDPADMQPYDMLVKYHEAGYVFGNTNNGSGTRGTYLLKMPDGTFNTFAQVGIEPVRGVNLTDTAVSPYLTSVSDFGATVKSFNSSLPMVNVGKIDSNLAFMDDIYGVKHVRKERPDQSYVIDEDRESIYFSFNFDTALTDYVTLTGNAGVRRVTDTLTIKQNVYDSNRLARDVIAGSDVNHTYYIDQGDKFTTVKHSHFLPSINANFAFGDEYKVKVSYDERTSMQALNQFGEGTRTGWTSRQTDPATGSNYQAIDQITKGGNPYLKPWDVKVYNLAGEWYPTDTSLLGLTFFYMDMAGFTSTVTTQDLTAADSDGVVRRGARVVELQNGSNANVEGVEFSYQQSFDFLPGILANTGTTFNYTYSPSEREGFTFASDGEQVPFNATGKNQSNLVLWYSDEMFEFRIAANYLDKRYNGNETGVLPNDNERNIVGGLPVWNESTLYVDLGATYHVNEMIDVSFNVTNLTEEGENQYMQWKSFYKEYNAFERRMVLGVTAKF